MENVDSFTQEYLERARQRREMLTKKLADTSPRRKSKRGIPLSESSDENIPSAKEDDDSPNKRQCLREGELGVKPDTPAVPGVRSRMNRLLTDRSNWDNGAPDHMDMDPTPAKAAPVESEPVGSTLRDKSPAPGARRNRLAALAQNINDWEDDLHHPVIKKEEKVKKVWQPPPKEVTPPAREPSPLKKNPSGPSKPSRIADLDDKPSSKYSPVKMISSPQKEYRQEGEKVVSSLTVKLGSSSSLKQEEHKSPAKAASPIKSYTERVSRSPMKQASPAKPKVVAPEPVVLSTVNTVIKPGTSGKKRRESFEPSAQPVSARLANWQTRVDKVESEKMDTCNNAASRIKATVTTPKVKASSHTITQIVEEPTEAPVHSRMANWEHKVQTEEKVAVQPKGFVASAVKHTPVTPRAKSPQKAAPAAVKSPVKSPAKVAPATKGIVDKLAKLQDSWKDGGIADKLKQQRQADLQVLENRWKNGVLNEDAYTSQNTPKDSPPEPENTIPPAPPLPTPGSSVSKSSPKKALAKNASPIKHVQAPQTAKTPKDDARKRIREDFENKLKTLGFEMEADKGHVATLDLKEQRERDRQKREAEKQKPKTNINVTEKVVTTVTFDNGEKVTKTEKLVPGTPSSMTVKAGLTPKGGSLYGLIKHKNNGGGQMSTPGVSGTMMTPGGSTHKKFHDSFSSDETSFEEDTPPKTIEIKQSIQFQSPDEYTESDLSETEGGSTQSDEYSESEADETEYTLDETEADISDEQGVDHLIDEAFSDTETDTSSLPPVAAPRHRREDKPPSPQYVARKLPPEAHPGHPDHRPPNEPGQNTPGTSRTAPPKHPRLHEQQQQPEKKHVGFISPGGSTYRSNSSGSEKSIRREKPYSIDNYRSSANVKRNAPEPKMKIIRRSEHFDTDDTDVDPQPSFVPPESAKQRIQTASSGRLRSMLQELQELVTQEQNVIMQTSNALNQCCGNESVFAGSQESVECHRLLLQACKKREAYITEMQKLKTRQQPVPVGPKGSLTVSDIRLPLKNDFISRLGSIHDNTIHYFLVLFRHGAHVIFTQMVNTLDAIIRGSLDIPNLIKLNDIRQDFVVDVEIYHMSVTREVPAEKTPKKKKGMTPKKLASASKRQQLQSPGGPLAVRTTNFTFIAGLSLTMRMVDKTHFNLDRVPFSSPLQGTIHMRLRCLMEISVEEKGFLTMFEDVSGLGAWHRRWCVLKHNSLSFWKYPDDVKYKDPIGTIDLKCCISDEIGLVPRDVCARPNTLELLTVRRQQRGETDTLVSRCYNTMTTTKHWISADTKDDRAVWAIKLNEALRNLRAWNPDALRPIKRQQKQ